MNDDDRRLQSCQITTVGGPSFSPLVHHRLKPKLAMSAKCVPGYRCSDCFKARRNRHVMAIVSSLGNVGKGVCVHQG
jgi:hypothetical protein